MLVDAATREEPQADLTRILRRPYACLPWLQEQAAIPTRVHYGHRRGPNYRPGLGLPLDRFTGDQQWHLVAHQMRNLPTMTVPAERSAHCSVWLSSQCLLDNNGPETARHLQECPVQSHEWCPARQRPHTWLTTYVGPQALQVQGQLWDSVILEHGAVVGGDRDTAPTGSAYGS